MRTIIAGLTLFAGLGIAGFWNSDNVLAADAVGVSGAEAKLAVVRQMIADAEDNYRGTRSELVMKMRVQNTKIDRSYKIRSYEQNRSTGMTRILEPQQDRGTAFLKHEGVLYLYDPGVRKIIPIPAAMMGNSFLGSDFSYDDMARESNVLEDFDFAWVGEERCRQSDNSCGIVDMTPHEDTTVAYGKQRVWIDLTRKVYERIQYFDEDGIHVKSMDFDTYEMIENRLVARHQVMRNEIEKERVTEVTLESITFQHNRPDSDFTKAALRKVELE